MNLNEAGQIISIIDGRVQANTGNVAQQDTTYAQVAALGGDGTVSAYLYGAATATPYLRTKNGLTPRVNDAVKVSMHGPGDMWIEEVIPSAYYPMQFDIAGGVINWGPYSTGVTDTNLYRSGTGTLRTDSHLSIGGEIFLGSTGLPIQSPSANTITIGAPFQNTELILEALDNTGEILVPSAGTLEHRTVASGGTYFVNRASGVDASQIGANLTTDSYLRAVLEGDSTLIGLKFGPGTATQDTTLYRSAAGMLRSNGSLTLDGANLYMGADSRLVYATTWGGGGNQIGITNASGSTAIAFRAGGLYIGGNFGDPAPATAGIQFGADTSLYRSAANTLTTPGSLNVSGKISGIKPTTQVLTASSGTYTTPANVTHIIVECIGGGGAGGGAVTGAAGEHSVGGGGGSGGYSRGIIANPSSSYSYTVGGGGSGVSGGTGNAGGSTTFGGTLVVANGGSGGNNSATNTATYSGAIGGAGASAGTGYVSNPGQMGGWGFGSGALCTGGVGAPSPLGGGGGSPASLLSQPGSANGGAAAAGTGAGGGGAGRTGTGAAATGGAGGSGAIIVTEFYAS